MQKLGHEFAILHAFNGMKNLRGVWFYVLFQFFIARQLSCAFAYYISHGKSRAGARNINGLIHYSRYSGKVRALPLTSWPHGAENHRGTKDSGTKLYYKIRREETYEKTYERIDGRRIRSLFQADRVYFL